MCNNKERAEHLVLINRQALGKENVVLGGVFGLNNDLCWLRGFNSAFGKNRIDVSIPSQASPQIYQFSQVFRQYDIPVEEQQNQLQTHQVTIS